MAKKISLYEDGFYVPGMNTMEAEIPKRNMLAEHMGAGGWHILIDVDEYFIDFPALVHELRSLEEKDAGVPITLRAYWCSIFKISAEGFFWSHNTDFATEDYFRFWKSIDAYNYKYFHDFHPLYPACWKSLKFVEGETITEVMKKYRHVL